MRLAARPREERRSILERWASPELRKGRGNSCRLLSADWGRSCRVNKASVRIWAKAGEPTRRKLGMIPVPEVRWEPEAAAKSDVRIINYPHATFMQYLCRGESKTHIGEKIINSILIQDLSFHTLLFRGLRG